MPRRRWAGALALAAAVGVAAFGIGFLAGNNGNGGAGSSRVIAMSGTSASPGSSASLILYNDDAAGNWPMKLSIQGLAPAPADRPYELWLTKNGRLAALCGSFLVESSGTTVVPMNAPYELKEYTGWVVVVEGSRKPLLTTA